MQVDYPSTHVSHNMKEKSKIIPLISTTEESAVGHSATSHKESQRHKTEILPSALRPEPAEQQKLFNPQCCILSRTLGLQQPRNLQVHFHS